ncbi:MAG: PAC2 family protein [Fervidicoccaceae archaeon]
MSFKRISIYLSGRKALRQGYRVISGFKGFGAVGIITVLHIVSSLNMEKIGVVVTKYQPEYVYREEDLVYPFEIYVSHPHRLVALVNRELPDERVREEYVYELTKLISRKGLSPLYLIGGLDHRFRERPEERLRWLKNSTYKGPVPNTPMLDRGLLVIGPLALQLMFSELMGIPTLALLPYASAETPDPTAAAVAVEELNKLLDINVPTDKLIEEGMKIQEELRRLEELSTQKHGGREPYM